MLISNFELIPLFPSSPTKRGLFDFSRKLFIIFKCGSKRMFRFGKRKAFLARVIVDVMLHL